MALLVLVRHGESQWNLENRFTGWVDVPLTDTGRREAQRAGELLRGMHFDRAYTSVLQRAIETLDIILRIIGQADLPIERPMRFDLVESATVPQHAMSPNRPLLGIGAILVALALGLGVGFALDAHDKSIRDPEQLRDLSVTTPILAIIPKVDMPKGGFVTHGPKAEA